MGVLGPIVEQSGGVLVTANAEVRECCAVGAKAVSCDGAW